ncbi:MAG: glutamate-5-semialdehyde dehydrogenase [Eggerthellaceae bacterium]|jgi:glutamate-5-semialdehyde dehydrogenase
MSDQDARKEARKVAEKAKEASVSLGSKTTLERNTALAAMAQALREKAEEIVAANEKDMEEARKKNTAESLLDRLMLDKDRVFDMAAALDDLTLLEDPVGKVLDKRKLDSGLELTRVTVPLGVVAVVYEARPNVTSDACGICLKAGNAVVLRGGSLALHSNVTIGRILQEAAVGAGFPEGCIGIISSPDRSATDELMNLHGVVDVLVPRGGAGLIRHCVENARVPVIETGTGNCHVYVHASADESEALSIVMNAKTRRYGVCNAAESLLVDQKIAPSFLPCIGAALREKGVVLHADAQAKEILDQAGIDCVAATPEDWGREYLGPEISIHLVSGVEEAIEHINAYGTHHSESIVANDESAIEAFLAGVDAAAVYANASTAFTDGGQFGLGAEIGISTQKLHVRGPFALEGLTSYKYILRGKGQVRA